MLAILHYAGSPTAALRYNEEKIRRSEALGLAAPGFPGDLDRLSLEQKRQRFAGRMELNRRVRRPLLHASLNFHPADRLDNARMAELGLAYLEALGLGRQPALLYRHLDAAHPHLHMLTVLIRRDGSCVHPFEAARTRARERCRQLERAYGLRGPGALHADSGCGPFLGQLPRYGQDPTAGSLDRVVRELLAELRCDRLEAYEVLLRLRGVQLIRGQQDSFLRQRRGLLYQMLGAGGKPLGVPVAASRLHCRPVLEALEQRLAVASRELEPWALSVSRKLQELLAGCPQLPSALLERRLQQAGLKLHRPADGEPLVLDPGRGLCLKFSRLDARSRGLLVAAGLWAPPSSGTDPQALGLEQVNLRSYLRRQLSRHRAQIQAF